MMQVPWRPLVMPTGSPCHSGWSCCSIEAKKAFISARIMARGHSCCWHICCIRRGFPSAVGPQLPGQHALDAYTVCRVDQRRQVAIFSDQLDAPSGEVKQALERGFLVVNQGDNDFTIVSGIGALDDNQVASRMPASIMESPSTCST